MKERILVTGGTGYIGSHTVVESLSILASRVSSILLLVRL